MELSSYVAIFSLMLYGLLLVPYVSSRILSSHGENERSWFFLILVFNIYCLLYVFLSKNLRSKLLAKEKFIFALFVLGYLVIFPLCVIALRP